MADEKKSAFREEMLKKIREKGGMVKENFNAPEAPKSQGKIKVIDDAPSRAAAPIDAAEERMKRSAFRDDILSKIKAKGGSVVENVLETPDAFRMKDVLKAGNVPKSSTAALLKKGAMKALPLVAGALAPMVSMAGEAFDAESLGPKPGSMEADMESPRPKTAEEVEAMNVAAKRQFLQAIAKHGKK